MKKHFVKFILPFISFSLFSCSPKTNDLVKGKYSFSLGAHNQDAIAAIKEMVKDYEDKHPRIDLVVTYHNYQTEGLGKRSDIWFTSAAFAQELINDIETIPDKYSKTIKEKMGSSAIQHFLYQDSFSCFPMGILAHPSFYYFGDVFTEEEVKSWDTIIEKTKTFDSVKKNAFSYFAADEYMGAFHANGLVTSFSGNSVTDNLNTAKGLEVAKGLSKLFGSEYIDSDVTILLPENHEYLSCAGREFVEGSMSYYFGEQMKVSEMPSFSYEGSSFSWSSSLITYGIYLAKQQNAAKRDVLLDFAHYLSQQEALISFPAESYLSVYKDDISCYGNDSLINSQVLNGKEYVAYPDHWYSIMDNLIRSIKEDAGQLNENNLQKALDDYHNAVMALQKIIASN